MVNEQKEIYSKETKYGYQVFEYKYGRMRPERDLDSLAAYKFLTYDNAEDLKDDRDYSEFDIYKCHPVFEFQSTVNSYNSYIREIVSPEGFFKHLMEEMVGFDDSYKEIFQFEVSSDWKTLRVTFKDPDSNFVRMKWDDDYVQKLEEMPIWQNYREDADLSELFGLLNPEPEEME